MIEMWNGMGILTQRLSIWPQPLHLLAEGSKLFHIKILREVSASLDYSYPQVKMVEPSHQLIRNIQNGVSDAVLKREFSSKGEHVYTAHTKDATVRLTNAIRAEHKAYSAASGFPRPKWFVQPYIPSLLYLGEIRAHIVNGTFFHAIVTTPSTLGIDDLQIQQAMLFTPLSKLR